MPNVLALRTCCYCGGVAGGDYAIHRDDMGVGPELPLCKACAEDDAITCEAIWAKTSKAPGDICAQLDAFYQSTTTPYERQLHDGLDRLYRLVRDHAPAYERVAREVLKKAMKGE